MGYGILLQKEKKEQQFFREKKIGGEGGKKDKTASKGRSINRREERRFNQSGRREGTSFQKGKRGPSRRKGSLISELTIK